MPSLLVLVCFHVTFNVRIVLTLLTGAGLGRMLARGFAANGAIALTLVDLNLAGLEQTRDEIIDIIEHGRTQPKVTL